MESLERTAKSAAQKSRHESSGEETVFSVHAVRPKDYKVWRLARGFIFYKLGLKLDELLGGQSPIRLRLLVQFA